MLYITKKLVHETFFLSYSRLTLFYWSVNKQSNHPSLTDLLRSILPQPRKSACVRTDLYHEIYGHFYPSLYVVAKRSGVIEYITFCDITLNGFGKIFLNNGNCVNPLCPQPTFSDPCCSRDVIIDPFAQTITVQHCASGICKWRPTGSDPLGCNVT